MSQQITSVEASTDPHDVAKAKAILRGESIKPEEALELSKRLKEQNAFRYAWRVLERARGQHVSDAGDRLKLAQQQALCTYKDPDLPIAERLSCAFEILQEADDLPNTTNQETLGLAGAICKRRWEVDGQIQHLERALAYYRRGYEVGIANDYGYTAINAAFVLDLLAAEESATALEAGSASHAAGSKRSEAERMREEMVSVLPDLPDEPDKAWLKSEWWFVVTIAEAYFGLRNYQEAAAWLKEARKIPGVPDWEFASTARQLARLAQLHEDTETDFEGTLPWETLREFLGGDVIAVRTVFAGKVGLALSGGGFRAALFHIGVLARLAELDMLRHVEVLSCVSGGSIVGAHYYLELRKLLEDKPDTEITHQDYLDLVSRLQSDFLAGVQRNIRMRVLASWSTNVRMIFSPGYSRTERVGELYESEIFSRARDGASGERWLNGLFIQPRTAAGTVDQDFKPKYDNWRRINKVPTLILNATTLNTGHNWQFTASWMGESPASIDSEVDANERFRRMYYTEAPTRHQRVRLGHAVGASSCVPALFEPIVLADLYPDRTVRLVDGGVHDNQGMVGLLEQDCTVLLVSDASGQMDSEAVPSKSELGVLLRSNSILQARVRGAGVDDLKARVRSSLLRGLMFLHLKQDLGVEPVDWIDTEDPFEISAGPCAETRRGPLTSYGIQRDVQRLLAGIRTDLDSFTDVEAYALMTSGYRMTEHQFPRSITGFAAVDSQSKWDFLSVERLMREKSGSEDFKEVLRVGANIPLKVWMLSKTLRFVGVAILVLVGLGFVWLACTRPELTLLTVTIGSVAWAALAALIAAVLGRTAAKFAQPKDTLSQAALGLFMATFGWLLAWVHLHVFDKIFLKLGEVDRFVPNSDGEQSRNA